MQRHAEQLDTDKQAVHSVYLGRIEKGETNVKKVREENQKVKRQYEKMEASVARLTEQRDKLEEEKRNVLEQEGGLGKRIAWLEERLEEERTLNQSTTEQLKASKRDVRQLSERVADLELQHDMLTKENKHFKTDLDRSRQAESDMQIQLGHAKSQLKQSEANAAELDLLVTKFHECDNKRRVAGTLRLRTMPIGHVYQVTCLRVS